MSTSSGSVTHPSTTRLVGLMAALLVAVFAFQLNASMLSPVLATMESELHTTSAQIGLTQTAFFAAAALFSLFLPRWGDLIGRKRILMGMLAVTAIGCIISALAPNVAVLAVGRVVQGVAGPMVPIALIMLHQQIREPRQYAKYMAVLTSVNGGIAGIDALAGGWLAQAGGFRAVFWAMTVVCVIALVAVIFGTVESRSSERVPMDWAGVVTLVIVLGALYFAFNEAGNLAAANWWLIIGLIVLGAVAFAVFWQIEKRHATPLVTTTYMKQRRTWALLTTTLLTMTGVFAVMNGLIPNLAQDTHIGPGISTGSVSWVTLTPYAVAGLLMGLVSGQLASKFGYHRVLQAGLALTIVGLVGATLFAAHPTPVLLLVVSIFVGITYAGMCNIMLNGLGIVLSPPDNEGYLPGMNAGAFNLGAGLSFALLFAIQTAVGQSAGDAAGYRFGILAGAVLIALALVMSFLIPRVDDEAAAQTAPAKHRRMP